MATKDPPEGASESADSEAEEVDARPHPGRARQRPGTTGTFGAAFQRAILPQTGPGFVALGLAAQRPNIAFGSTSQRYANLLPKTPPALTAPKIAAAFTPKATTAAGLDKPFANWVPPNTLAFDAAKLSIGLQHRDFGTALPGLYTGSTARSLFIRPPITTSMVPRLKFNAATHAHIANLFGSRSQNLGVQILANNITTDFLQIKKSRAMASAFVSASASRHRSLVKINDLHRLLQKARDAQPPSITTDTLFETVVIRSAYDLPPPLDESGLLVDDPATVAEWVATLISRVVATSGLNERDLKEDAVAIYVYALTASVALVLLLNFPLLAAVGSLMGAAAHPPAVIASRLSRRVYRQVNDDPGPASEQ